MSLFGKTTPDPDAAPRELPKPLVRVDLDDLTPEDKLRVIALDEAVQWWRPPLDRPEAIDRQIVTTAQAFLAFLLDGRQPTDAAARAIIAAKRIA